MERGSFIFMSIPYVPPIRLFLIYYLEKISSQRYEPIRPRVRERNCRHPACVLRHTVASVMTTRDRLCMVLEQNRTPDKPIQCTGHDSVQRHISYRTPNKPIQHTGRDSVHTTRRSCCSISKGVTFKPPCFMCVDLTDLKPILCCIMHCSMRVKMRTEYINVFNLIFFSLLAAPG